MENQDCQTRPGLWCQSYIKLNESFYLKQSLSWSHGSSPLSLELRLALKPHLDHTEAGTVRCSGASATAWAIHTPLQKSWDSEDFLGRKPAKIHFSDIAFLASARDSAGSLILSSCRYISTPRNQRKLLRRERHSLSFNLSPFLTATKKNTEKYSYFQLLYFKLVYSLRLSSHKFCEIVEQFYYALAASHIYILFSFVQLKISVTTFPSYCRFTINCYIARLQIPSSLKSYAHVFASPWREDLTLIWQLKTLLKAQAYSQKAWNCCKEIFLLLELWDLRACVSSSFPFSFFP